MISDTSKDIDLICLTPAGLLDPSLAIAAIRAGHTGVLNTELEATSDDLARIDEVVARLARFAPGPFGLKLSGLSGFSRIAQWRDQGLELLVLDRDSADVEDAAIQAFRRVGGRVQVEVTEWTEACAGLESLIDGWWIKGHEAGGLVGEESSFVLLQRVARKARLPIFVRGGVGVHNAAACSVGGAAGVVLDSQLLLFPESPPGRELEAPLATVGSEDTQLIGNELQGCYLRVLPLERRGFVDPFEATSPDRAILLDYLRQRTHWRIGHHGPDGLLPVGQDVAFAPIYATRYRRLAGLLAAIVLEAGRSPRLAASQAALMPDAALATEHGTPYPVVQGAMTRVSDVPAFAEAVAAAGALPMLALALLKADRVRALLEQTSQRLGDRPWGVGILGFVPKSLRDEQLAVLHELPPPFAYIAGGRPDQAEVLEAAGIHCYLHAPTRGLLRLFLEQGARRFIVEGRECGGHIGPVSSLVLWESAVRTLLEFSNQGGDLAEVRLLFAGGIHDQRSAAMVATLAASIVERGAAIGVLMGTAYLLTPEAVASGAVAPAYQEVALECVATASLTTGTGHASRCARTAFVSNFHQTKQAILAEAAGAKPDLKQVREQLDDLTLGRLRIASKGLTREGEGLKPLSETEQLSEGMYMIGQVAALHRETSTIDQLHHSVTDGAQARLEQFAESMQADVPLDETPGPADIAIVGMGAILPGARTTSDYWENILDRLDAIREIPRERWDWRLYFDRDRQAPDKVYSKWGGFIDDVAFDPTRYGIPPKSIKSVEPLQLLTLEVVRQALDDADLAVFDGEQTSVILGASGGLADLGLQYATRSNLPRITGIDGGLPMQRLPEWTEDSFAGILPNVTAGRSSNRFDLGGVSCTVDAACASSLAAVYLGVNELNAGRCDTVVVGGVDTMQSPFAYLCFAKTQALSPRGRCRTFDETADGTVISEGLAAVVLKRLPDAERDGDRIYAVIKGVGGSSDGRAKGLTAPHPEGQMRALFRAYRQAGYSPATLGLVEAHGTGTVAGDRAELEMLSTLMVQAEAVPGRCVIGSVKTQIGHTKAAAGVSGLIKATLGLYHRTLPPQLLDRRPQEVLRGPRHPLYVLDQAVPWIAEPGEPRRAGVSAFGFGGTNYHVTIEEHRDDPLTRSAARQHRARELLVLSATDSQALRDDLEQLQSSLAKAEVPDLSRLAYDLQRRADGGSARCALLVDQAGLASALQALIGHLDDSGTILPRDVWYSDHPLADQGGLALLFPGQGAQYPGMLAGPALAFPQVTDVLDRCNQVLFDLGASFDREVTLARCLFPPRRYRQNEAADAMDRLTRTEIAQPAIGAVSAALWALFRGFNLRPAMAAGHSYGEFVALHAAGVFDLDALMTLSEARGRHIVEQAAGAELGTMLALRGDWEALGDALRDIDGLVAANHNAPDQFILSGSQAAIDAAAGRLKGLGVHCSPLKVAAAFHSPLVAPAKERLAEVLAAIEFSTPRFPVYNNQSAARHSADPAMIRDAMADHLVQPVRFVDQIRAMYQDGARVFLELGPKRVLTNLTGAILGDRSHLALAVDDKGPGIDGILRVLGQLHCHGFAPDLSPLYRGRLIEVSGSEPASATDWLIGGSYTRKPDEPPLIGARSQLTLEDFPSGRAESVPSQPPDQPVTGVETSTARSDRVDQGPPSAPAEAPGSLPGATGADQVLVAFQETMRRFLAMQERVMTAYFAGGAGLPEPTGAQSPSLVAREDTGSPTAPADTKTLNIKAQLLEVASDRTGYPTDMLGLDQDIEADLGIDSIKRVEILGALRKSLPDDLAERLQSAMDELAGQRTFGEMIAWAESKASEPGAPTDSSQVATVEEGVRPSSQAGPESIRCPLSRFIIRAHPEPLDHCMPELPRGVYLILPDRPRDAGQGIAEALAAELGAAGRESLVMPEGRLGDLDGLDAWLDQQPAVRNLVVLSGIGDSGWTPRMTLARWRERMSLEVKALYPLLRRLGPELRQNGVVLIASAMGGCFGRDSVSADVQSEAFPGTAGLSGLIKTLTFEWLEDRHSPSFRSKSVDLDPEQSPQALAGQVLRELGLGGRREVGYPRGVRTIFRTLPASLVPSPQPRIPDKDWVILATGGAKGITAECLRPFAAHGCTLVVVGRSAEPVAEPPELAALTDKSLLRKHLIAVAKAEGRRVTPKGVERDLAGIMARREIRANLDDLRRLGAQVDYRSLDVRDEPAVGELLDDLYRRFGRIDVVFHGAGIIEDRLLMDKATDSVERVFDTKVDSAFLLAQRLQPESLEALVFFTSVAGRFGNRGQSDYASANEVLARMAWLLESRWADRERRPRAIAVNWGPWGPTAHGEGMVTPEVAEQFRRRGVELVDAEAGSDFLYREIVHGGLGDVELVAGEGPWEYDEIDFDPLPEQPVEGRIDECGLPLLHRAVRQDQGVGVWQIDKMLDLVSDPYLDHHRLDGVPVMPFAFALEYLAEAVAAIGPAAVVELRELAMLQGVRLLEEATPDRCSIRIAETGEASVYRTELFRASRRQADGPPERSISYRGVVVTGSLEQTPSYRLPPFDPSETPVPVDVPHVYGGWLFHGPSLQTIVDIERIDQHGLLARLRVTTPCELYPPAKEGQWLFDPALLDGAFQLVLVWSRAIRNNTPLPARIGRIRRFGNQPLPDELRCSIEVVSDPMNPLIQVHVYLFDDQGRLRIGVEDFYGSASAALNRVGGAWAGGTVGE